MTDLSESEFYSLAGATLATVMEHLENTDISGTLEVDETPGSLTIETAQGKIFVLSHHAPTRQIWLSSPLSGGLHFRYERSEWVLPDGRRMEDILYHELSQVTGMNYAR